MRITPDRFYPTPSCFATLVVLGALLFPIFSSASETPEQASSADAAPAPAVDSNMWQVKKDGEAPVPLSKEEIEKRIAEGTIQKDALVAQPGMTNWVPASSVFQFPAALEAPSPQEDGPSGVNSENAAVVSEERYYATIGGSAQGPFTKKEMEDKIRTKTISRETLVAPVGSTQWVKAETTFSFDSLLLPPAVTATPGEKWYAFVGGKNYGPYTRARLEAMYKSGEIQPTTQINKVGTQEWTTAQAVLSPAEVGPPSPPPGNASTNTDNTRLSDMYDDIPSYSGSLTAPKILAGIGAGTWTTGFIISFVAAGKFIKATQNYSNEEDDDDDPTAAVEAGLEESMGLFVASGIMLHAGPILSAIGEKVAKNRVGQHNTKGFRTRKMSAGAMYGFSWLCTLGQVASIFIPGAGIFLYVAFGIMASAYRGAAAWSPIIRLAKKGGRGMTTTGFTPLAFHNGAGLSLSGSF